MKAAAYSASTHVGNWQEDKIQREERLKELQQKRDAGLLGGVRRTQLIAAAQQPVDIAHSKDGLFFLSSGLFLVSFLLPGSLLVRPVASGE